VADITDQVVDFYNALFLGIFFEPFKGRITDRRRRDAVRSQVLEAAGAASQSLERFLVGQRHTQAQVECLLTNLSVVTAGLTVEQVSNQYVAPEGVVELLLAAPAAAEALRAVLKGGQETVFRVALYSVVQALMQIGPVIAEWQSIGFPSTFELTRRVVARLNDISAQLEELGKAGSEAADERFELLYRDYLSQRFYRVEAGTVRMTTNVSVDLRELFVMPNVVERSLSAPETGESAAELMALSKAIASWVDGPVALSSRKPMLLGVCTEILAAAVSSLM
jgi:hypothetical protein